MHFIYGEDEFVTCLVGKVLLTKDKDCFTFLLNDVEEIRYRIDEYNYECYWIDLKNLGIEVLREIVSIMALQLSPDKKLILINGPLPEDLSKDLECKIVNLESPLTKERILNAANM